MSDYVRHHTLHGLCYFNLIMYKMEILNIQFTHEEIKVTLDNILNQIVHKV